MKENVINYPGIFGSINEKNNKIEAFNDKTKGVYGDDHHSIAFFD